MTPPVLRERFQPLFFTAEDLRRLDDMLYGVAIVHEQDRAVRYFRRRTTTPIREMRIETLTGVLLIMIGVILLLIGVAPRLLESIPKLHPIIYTQVSLGELKIGTSPLAIIILTIIYLFLALRG